jgi:hypothetical protein
VVAWGNSSVVARENSSVVARENSSVVARENSSVVAWGSVCVRIYSEIKSLSLFGFSVLFKPFDLSFSFKKESTCIIQEVRPQKYLQREGIAEDNGAVILFKRVSKDFITQEGCKNETKWQVGSTVTHSAWNPSESESGEGKFHACSRPYFCDEFRNKMNDRYIAIQVNTDDLYEWENPCYQHKIAFRKCRVLHEVDRAGRRINREP